MERKPDALGLLGLSMRKGAVVTGTERTLRIIREGKRSLVFLARDAGDNLSKKIRQKTEHYRIPLHEEFSSDELSEAIGRKNIKVCALVDADILRAFEGRTEEKEKRCAPWRKDHRRKEEEESDRTDVRRNPKSKKVP